MGSINLKHTGSGSAIALSSDGTSLLLDGTAIGGGGGGADLYAENYVSGTKPDASSSTNGVAIGRDAISTGSKSIAIGTGRASGTYSIAMSIVTNTTSYGASNNTSIAIGYNAKSTNLYATAIGYGSHGNHSSGVAIGRQAVTTATNQVALNGTNQPVKISGTYTLPTADGTNGQVMTTDGSGAVTFADAGGGGGVTGFTSADNTSSPNNTVNIASLSVNSSSTNAGAAIVTKGTGALMLGIPDSGTTGGNVRGASAVDLGIYRTSANQVASGTESILLGNRMRASGTEGIAIGKNSYANATRAIAMGYDSNCHASESLAIQCGGSGSPGQYGIAIGAGSKSGTRGCSVSRGRSVTSSAFSRGGYVQQLQTAECEYWGRTTNATLATISSEGLNQSDTEAHFLALVTDDAYYNAQNFAYMSAKVIANDATNSLLKVLELSAAFRIATDGTVTQVGTTTKTVIHSEGTALNAIDIDTTITNNRRLVLDVTGVASTNIHWTAWVKLHRNRYA